MREKAFPIELIMPHEAGEAIQKQCGYLNNIVPIGHIKDGDFSAFLGEAHAEMAVVVATEGESASEGEDQSATVETAENSDTGNPFAYWLRTKIEYHVSRSEIADLGISERFAVPEGVA
jgi:hypothetical protein